LPSILLLYFSYLLFLYPYSFLINGILFSPHYTSISLSYSHLPPSPSCPPIIPEAVFISSCPFLLVCSSSSSLLSLTYFILVILLAKSFQMLWAY
jgi:hypothetical protein